jgi:hypothetical protein
MKRACRQGEQGGSRRLRGDASQALGRQAGPSRDYTGEIFDACRPFGPCLVS